MIHLLAPHMDHSTVNEKVNTVIINSDAVSWIHLLAPHMDHSTVNEKVLLDSHFK